MRLATLGSIGAVLATTHTWHNMTQLPAPPALPPPVAGRVSVLLPVRDEVARAEACLRSVLAQQRVADLEVLVLDDGSTDATADVVRRCGLEPLPGKALLTGWLGKPWACQQLADAATGELLVFLDADVVLQPEAVAATVWMLDRWALDLLSPYPRQLADGLGARLIQPLLQWSWLTFLPLGLALRSPRPSLVAANGQFLAIRRSAYDRAGGHGAVRGEVIEDVALLRAVKRSGGHGGVADGTRLASCRMYDSWDELREGYTKSLWTAFGSPAGAAAVIGLLGLLYVVPPVAAVLRGSRLGALGYAAGVAGRGLTAYRTGSRILPDTLAHPASVLTLGWLTAQSLRRQRSGRLTWKGRPLHLHPHPPLDPAGTGQKSTLGRFYRYPRGQAR